MCNLVNNPRFGDSGLSYWTLAGSPVYVANDGNEQLGCVRLAAPGDAVSQSLSVAESLLYTVALVHKGAGAEFTVSLVNQEGDTVYTDTVVGTAVWVEESVEIGLPASTLTLVVESVSGSILIDDVSFAHIPATRVELATMTHSRLSDLATEFGLSYAASGDLTEGDYTHAVSAAMRDLGFINGYGEVDVRCVDPGDVDRLISRIEEHMLPVLHNKASVRTEDYSLGPLREKKSTTNALAMRMGILPGMSQTVKKTVGVRKLTRGC